MLKDKCSGRPVVGKLVGTGSYEGVRIRIENVPPETYQLFVTGVGADGEADNVGYAQFTIDTIPGGASDEPHAGCGSCSRLAFVGRVRAERSTHVPARRTHAFGLGLNEV